jgi:hypothetical protein
MENMKVTKNILIVGGIICLGLVLLFLSYIFILSQSIISIESENILKITPKTIEKLNNIENSILFTQTPNPPGVYSTDMIVQISGTGGEGLRIRAYAGLNELPMFLGTEGDFYKIVGGPEIIDNAIWWKIQSIENTDRIGWAVQNYLSQH